MSSSASWLAVLLLCGLWAQDPCECYPLTDCEEYGDYTQVSTVQSTLCGLVWHDQNKEQIQNVFKRFLFHYSKAQNSIGSVARESHSVHPLMRLSPKFSQRRKKQQKLKTACRRPDRLVRDVLCPFFGCIEEP